MLLTSDNIYIGCWVLVYSIEFAGMLDHIIVESGGVKTLLNRVSAVSVLNPKLDNERLIAPIPPLTKEHMQIEDLTKKYIAEDVC
nr:ribosome-recycling factor, chloroplastic [Ipomoea batatas]GMD23902.1 ribosome-recycling factor, chloroplastic [Ipomoea batatas]GME00960.1 ribosome-recycling factor, chloroplastic [Ipomoea batatas]